MSIRILARTTILAGLVLASAAAADADVFLKVDGAPGEATQRGFEGQIVLTGASMNISSFPMPDPDGLVDIVALHQCRPDLHQQGAGPLLAQADDVGGGRRAARHDRDHIHVRPAHGPAAERRGEVDTRRRRSPLLQRLPGRQLTATRRAKPSRSATPRCATSTFGKDCEGSALGHDGRGEVVRPGQPALPVRRGLPLTNEARDQASLTCLIHRELTGLC